jgi:hypothetical protein
MIMLSRNGSSHLSLLIILQQHEESNAIEEELDTHVLIRQSIDLPLTCLKQTILKHAKCDFQAFIKKVEIETGPIVV